MRIYNTKVNWSVCEITLVLLSAVFTRFKTKIYSKFFCFLATTGKKWVVSGHYLNEFIYMSPGALSWKQKIIENDWK